MVDKVAKSPVAKTKMGNNYETSPLNSETGVKRNLVYVDSSRSHTIPPNDFSVIKPIVSRNWNNSNLKSIDESESLEDILENTYESVDHPKMEKQSTKKIIETRRNTSNRISFELEDEFNWTAAGMFEDLTKQSSIFLAGSMNNNTVIRLQKTVTYPMFTSPMFTKRNSDVADDTLPLSVSLASNNDEPIETHSRPVSSDVTREEAVTIQQSGKISSTDNHDPTQIEDIPSNVNDNFVSASYSENGGKDNDGSRDNIQLRETCKHDELLEKISLLQLVVDELKKKYPQDEMITGEGDKTFSDNVSEEADISLRNKLKAEQIRNKERIRMREKKKEERRRKSVEIIEEKNRCDSINEKSDQTIDGNKSRESSVSQRNKLSKKKELWKKHPKKRNATTITESSGTDLSALSADEDEKLVVSDSTEISMARMHHNEELAKHMYEQNEAGGYPNNYVPPLQPHPPYSNPIFTPTALHTHNNLIFHPPLQIPYGHFPIQHPPHTVINNLNNGVPHHSSAPNHVVAIPKLNNLELEANTTEPTANSATNIVLPSGRGKARENVRIINNADLEKLEEAQVKARAKLKAFLDRADSGELLDSNTLNESVT